LSEDEALELADLVGGNALGTIGATLRSGRQLATASPDSDPGLAEPYEVANRVYQQSLWAGEALATVLQFHDSPAVRARVKEWNSRISSLKTSIVDDIGVDRGRIATGEFGAALDTRVPARLTRGPLDFDLPASRLEPEAAAWYDSSEFPLSGNARFELVNFIDGERTVTDIRNALSAEFGPVPTAAVARYLEDLVDVGVVEWAYGTEG
jgi:hypothetical protein